MKSRKSAPEYIVGIELIEFADKVIYMPFKGAVVNQPWAHLSDHDPLVFFCKMHVDPIVLSPLDSGICERWGNVPRQKNFLVAACQTIEQQLAKHKQRNVARLADNIIWRFTQPLFHSHEVGVESNCNHLQFLEAGRPEIDQQPIFAEVQKHQTWGFDIQPEDAHNQRATSGQRHKLRIKPQKNQSMLVALFCKGKFYCIANKLGVRFGVM